jgi:hypothetical protein
MTIRKDHKIHIEQGTKWAILLLEDTLESNNKRLIKGKWKVSTNPNDNSDQNMMFGTENPQYSYYQWQGDAMAGNLEIGFLMPRASHKTGEESALFWVKMFLAHVRRTATGRFEAITILKNGEGYKTGPGSLQFPEFHNYMVRGPIFWTPIYDFQ